MAERWSVAANDLVDVDEFDTITDCDGCGEEFDLETEGGVDDSDAFCGECYRDIFGAD